MTKTQMLTPLQNIRITRQQCSDLLGACSRAIERVKLGLAHTIRWRKLASLQVPLHIFGSTFGSRSYDAMLSSHLVSLGLFDQEK